MSQYNQQKSKMLFSSAQKVIPGGVNSPVRAFQAVGGIPPFMAKGYGPYLEDSDGNCYVDYVLSWGPLILGHAHPEVLETVTKALQKGTSFGAPTEREVQLAQKIVELVPSIEKVRLVNSGTEATMSAIRLARAYTGRQKIVKFEGCYHGHGDPFLIKAGSGQLTFSIPSTPGITNGVAQDTLVADFNHPESVEVLFTQYQDAIAAVIVEPVAGNMGCVLPGHGFLEKLRAITRRYGALLIFDEVITGFRVGLGGAQERFGVIPDLTTLGKIMGGGFPVGAYGGRNEIMSLVAPEGPVYQAGTLSGNPVSVSAGLKTLELISQPEFYENLDRFTESLIKEFQECAKETGIPLTINRIGSMFTLFFTDKPVMDFQSVLSSDQSKYGVLFHTLLSKGVYFPPSPYESLFTSSAHDQRCMEVTVNAFRIALSQMDR